MSTIISSFQNLTINVVVLFLFLLSAVHTHAQQTVTEKTSRSAKVQGQSKNPADGVSYRLVVQHGQRNLVRAVAISANNSLAITGYADGTARIWDRKTGRELRRLSRHDGSVESVALSQDGRIAVTGSADGTARVWSTLTGEELIKFGETKSSLGWVRSVAISSDARLVFTGVGKTIQKWEIAEGNLLKTFAVQECAIDSSAFSKNGRWVVTGCFDGRAQLWDTEAEAIVSRFFSSTKPVSYVSVSNDGKWLVTSGVDRTVRVWDGFNGNLIREYIPESGPKDDNKPGGFSASDDISSVAISEDGQWIVAGMRDNSAKLWTQYSDQPVHVFKSDATVSFGEGVVNAVSFSADSRLILTGSERARIWDRITETLDVTLAGRTLEVNAVAISQKSDLLVMGEEGGSTVIWDMIKGGESSRLSKHGESVTAVAITDDGQWVATGSKDRTARLWERTSGRSLRQFDGHMDRITSIAVSPDHQYLLTGCGDNVGRLWDIETATIRFKFEHASSVESVAFSSDGKFLLTASWDDTVKLWDTKTGHLQKTFKAKGIVSGIYSVAMSKDMKWVVAGYQHGQVVVFHSDTEEEKTRYSGHQGVVIAIAITNDSKTVVTSSWDGTVQSWDLETGISKFVEKEPLGALRGLAMTSNEQAIVTGNLGSIRLWDRVSGKRMGQLVSFEEGNWAVVGEDGRFDTNDLEKVSGLHWIVSDDALRPLPIEIFMREYYEPELLPRLLHKQLFPPIRSLAALNRVQPVVKIVSVKQEKGRRGEPLDTVAVTLTVQGATGMFGVENAGRKRRTGAYDLRLYRDGQLIKQWPSLVEKGPSPGSSLKEELTEWRRTRRLVKSEREAKTFIMRGIRWPKLPEWKSIKFTAYAFNEDRVKSETRSRTYDIPRNHVQRAPRAYVITIGVNVFENGMWPLSYAVNDAKQIGKTLESVLKAKDPRTNAKQYEDVVWVPLISDADKGMLLVDNARKSKVRAVFRLLGGVNIDRKQLIGIPGAQRLARANPEDLIIVAVSTHGDIDKAGRFYFLPHDIGKGDELNDKMLQKAISSEELSEWLRDVDAMSMVMIVDACHSAAVVRAGEFKPGPMGSRGLGQLAYDKRMRILAATQTDQYALETPQTEQGLLSYALIMDGLVRGEANFDPKEDDRIMLSEWLRYGAKRVPKLYEEWRQCHLRDKLNDDRECQLAVKGAKLKLNTPQAVGVLQQPALFDYSSSRDVVLGIVGK